VNDPNAQQIAHWNDASGHTWAELGPLLDRQMESVGLRTMDVLAPRTGERILEVGCGCGHMTVTLGRRVGPEGAVLGLDISRPMLEVARRRAAEAGLAHVRFVEADAQVHALEQGAFDGIFSRFGVMFFADPTAAFANLRRALRPGGRLTFLCWRSPAENPVMTTAKSSVKHLLPPDTPPAPGAPGPFAFADPAHVRRVLEGAGFADVALAPHDAPMGGNTLDDALTLALRVGPLGSALRANPELVPQVRPVVREALAAAVHDGAVWHASATWIVTARNP